MKCKPVFQLLILVTILFFSSCIKQKSFLEDEQADIDKYIEKTGLYFNKDASGIYYYVKNSGTGTKINLNDSISISYSAVTLQDTNYVFSKSENFTFKVGDKDIIEGWNIAAQMFTEGTRAIIIIPFKLAYGNRSVGSIPQYSTLIYDFRIISKMPDVEANTDFIAYIENLDSITRISSNNIYFTSYFDGIGNDVTLNSVQKIEYTLYDFDNNLLKSELSFEVVVGENNVNAGVDEGLVFFKQGGMGRLIIPYQFAFGVEGTDFVEPYSNLVYQIRVLSDDLQVMEHSDLQKYLFVNDIDVEPQASGLFYIEKLKGTGDSIFIGDTVLINYKASMLSSEIEFESCDTCEFILDTPDLPAGVNEGIKLMLKGGKAKLILPSVLGFGSEQHVIIPPYSNLIYEIEVLE